MVSKRALTFHLVSQRVLNGKLGGNSCRRGTHYDFPLHQEMRRTQWITGTDRRDVSANTDCSGHVLREFVAMSLRK